MIPDIKSLTEFKEHHWDMLLDYIGQGRVVPVLGPELLVANDNGKTVPFYQEITRRLTRYFGMPENPVIYLLPWREDLRKTVHMQVSIES